MNQIETMPAPSAPPRSVWKWTDVLLIAVASGAILFAGLMGIGVLILLVNGRRVSQADISTPLVSLAAGGLESVALIGSVFLLGLVRRHLKWSDLGLRPMSFNWLFGAIFLGLMVIPLSSVIATAVQTALGQPLQNPQTEFLLPPGLNLPTALVMLFLVGIAGPFAEEIFFRGVIYNWLREHWGFLPSAAVTSLIFGAAHVEPAIVVATFVLGFVIAWAYEASHSLWTSFLIHATNNTAVVLVLYIAVLLGVKM